jgi:hypothetical protein
MADPVTITKIAASVGSFFKDHWKIIIIAIFPIIIMVAPMIGFIISINMIFPQADVDYFNIYKDVTEDSDLAWYSSMAYDVVRLENYLVNNDPRQSAFNFLIVNFTEYDIV